MAMKESLRIVFMGSPSAALPTLEALLRSSHEVVAVVTQPDKAAGRGQKMHACPVASLARKKSLNLLQPMKLKDPPFAEALRALQPDLAIVVAYGKILPRAVLEAPQHGCWNLHFSLLPKYRGAAPVQWALIRGEDTTGVSVMRLVERLDAGPILAQRAEPILIEDSSATLEARLAHIGSQLVIETLDTLIAGTLKEEAQEEAQASLAPLLRKEEGHIDWNQTAEEIINRIRGLNPWPVAYSDLPPPGARVDKVRLKLYSAQALDETPKAKAGTILTANASEGLTIACRKGVVKITELQAPGKRRMTSEDFLRGHQVNEGTQLS